MSLSLFIWVQDWVKTESQTLILNLTENRTRQARGHVQPSVPLHQSCYSTVVSSKSGDTGFSILDGIFKL